MAITVKKVFKNGTTLYQMKLLAGHKGLNNLVQWVHIIEDSDVSSFLHGQELVFTAGILNKNDNWMIDFARRLYAAGSSAFVVNIGPHTKTVPKELIEFCDEVNMPLFTIPWETRMVDMTRDFCFRIMQNDAIEDSMSTTIQNIIFKIGDMDTQILQMERYGYLRDSQFCFLAIDLQEGKETYGEENREKLKIYAEEVARSIKELYLSFEYKKYLIIVLMDYSQEEVDVCINEFFQIIKKEKPKWKLFMGVSSNKKGMKNQGDNFDKALSATEMAIRKNEKIIYYDKLNVYKLLMASGDKTVLKDYYDETIGLLEEYDNENNTDLVDFLRTYFENNGSPQLVSEKKYIHRNTVNNQLKKIEKITGYNPTDLEDKVKLYLGFYIKDVM